VTADSSEVVRALLEAAGVHPAQEELTLLAALFPLLTERMRTIHELDMGDEP
jgi:hypothetical protein